MQIPPSLDPADALKEALPAVLLETHSFRGETTLIVAREHIVAAARYLRDTPGLVYNFLSDISAVDYYPDDDRPARFGVSYHLYSMLYNRRLRLKVFVPEAAPQVDTVTGIWPGANWPEREIFDMMGITFTGHPDLRRLLMPADWNGHPHRRDYPLGYEQVQFSFNVEEIIKHKPLAEE